jgi:hypothetical protein
MIARKLGNLHEPYFVSENHRRHASILTQSNQILQNLIRPNYKGYIDRYKHYVYYEMKNGGLRGEFVLNFRKSYTD